MSRAIAAIVATLAWAGTASAQDWIVQGSAAEGWTGATACAPGRDGHLTALCLSLGCETGLGPGATLSVSQAVPQRLEATVAVDGEVVGVLDFRLDASGITFGAPLEEQDRIVEALRSGRAAELRLDWDGGQAAHPLSLSGAQAAIDAALAACPGPASDPLPGGSLGQDVPGRASDDPAGEAIAENVASCAGGTTTVEPGFVRQADVDGDGIDDVLIDYLGLTCDGSRSFCGTGGCSQEIWLADPAGPYRLLLADLIVDIELPAPGRLRVVMDGGACGRSGAEVCRYDYRVEGGRLLPLG